MDQDSQNQSIDGMKPSDNTTPVSGIDGIKSTPRSSLFSNDEDAPENAIPDATVTPSNPVASKNSNKAKVFMVLFLILFLLAAAAAGYFYTKYTSTKSDLNDATKLSEQSANYKKQNDTLTQQSANLQKTVTAQTDYIGNLSTVANQLKTTCGKACDSITIPKASSTLPTPTPSATVKPSATPTATPKPTTTP
jgi:cell division protein FtsB